MLKTRIAFFRTPGWPLTNIHFERFIKRKANLVVFVSAPEEIMKSTVKKQQDLGKNIFEVSAGLGIKFSGMTVHFMDDGIDTGDIISKKPG